MVRKFKTMDGNNAAAHVSYAYTEVAGIYPITPSSPMADFVDQWSAAGLKNIFGTKVKVAEMQSVSSHGSTTASPPRKNIFLFSKTVPIYTPYFSY